MNVVRVDSITHKFSTRESGASARAALTQRLREGSDAITLDFIGVEPSPSFADEFIGRLAEEMGAREFRGRLHFANLTEPVQFLLRTVVNKRLRSQETA